MRWGAIFAVWTILALLSAVQGGIYRASTGRAFEWGPLVADRLGDWYTCALFTPAYFWLVRRYPLDRESWPRAIAALLGATSVFVVMKHALYSQLGVWTSPWLHPDLPSRAFSERFNNAMTGAYISETIAFWCLIGVVYAAEFYRRARDRELQAVRLRAELTEARLDALAAQLRPHFLFNALHGVSTLMHRDVNAADAMLANLADLLRRTLRQSENGDRHEVRLAEELETLRLYFAVIHERFRDRLTIGIDVPSALAHAMVPHFVLQPLVENALEHGISRRAGPGRIDVSAERFNGTLRLTVSDDGPGLSGREDESIRDGVGLSNTRRRLRELYGDEQELAVERGQSGSGLRVSVCFPYRQGSN
ncbi:MAG TPA: histidine kinase [Gemmatimonadaceae bacterium]|nr:histidine kinase [Gemmatimonadaceae bacterium]